MERSREIRLCFRSCCWLHQQSIPSHPCLNDASSDHCFICLPMHFAETVCLFQTDGQHYRVKPPRAGAWKDREFRQHNFDSTSSIVTLSRLPAISSLKITDRLFRYASPRLWNQLPDSFRQPSQSCLDSPARPLVNPFFVIVSTLSILHSFTLTPGSKPTFSTNPSHFNFT